jgi:hypothetical protein
MSKGVKFQMNNQSEKLVDQDYYTIYEKYDDYDEIYPSNGRSAGWCCSGGKKPFHTGKGTRAKVANIAKGLKSQPKLK